MAQTRNPSTASLLLTASAPGTARFIERVGTYDPRANPPAVVLNSARIAEWIRKGAQPTQTVKQLIKKAVVPVPAAEAKAE